MDSGAVVEQGDLVREVRIAASPDVVFEVVSRPEHIGEWWSDEAHFDAEPGATGTLVFGDPSSPDAHVPVLTVVEVDPPRRFSFWWSDDAEVAGPGNALLVTFEFEPAGDGTLLRMTESGWRERGWEAAVLEAAYLDHIAGWDHHLPHLVAYTEALVATS